MKEETGTMIVPVSNGKEPNRCLSCGTTGNIGRRRYCSIDCRQKLRQKLDMRCGLLQALKTLEVLQEAVVRVAGCRQEETQEECE